MEGLGLMQDHQLPTMDDLYLQLPTMVDLYPKEQPYQWGSMSLERRAGSSKPPNLNQQTWE